MTNIWFGILVVAVVFLITSLACTVAGVGLHHWLLSHPKIEEQEVVHTEPDQSLALTDPHTVPLEIVMIPRAGEAGDVPAPLDTAPHLTLVPALATSTPVEHTIEHAEMQTVLQDLRLQQLQEKLEKKDALRARYLRVLRRERLREARALLAVPEASSLLLTGPVRTALTRLQAAA